MAWNPFKRTEVQEKRAPERQTSDTPRSPNSFGSKNQQRSLVSYESAITAELAMCHPFVFFCLNTIASAVMTVNFYAEADSNLPTNERATVSAIKSMNALLQDPNLTFAADQLRYWIALNYACFGRVPLKIGKGIDGTPNGIYPLAVRWTKTKTDARGQIFEYVYGDQSLSETLPIRKNAMTLQAYAAEIFTPNLDGNMSRLNSNVTPLHSIGLPAEVMTLLLRRAIDTAGGHPNTKYVISSDKTITDEQQELLREHLEESTPGAVESGNILFLYNTTIKIDELNNDLSDIHSKMPSDDMGRMILRSFGIPVSFAGFGAADSAKYANNYDGSRASFWEDTIIPRYCGPIATGLTKALCPPGMVIKADLDTIPALGYSRALKAAAVNTVTFLTDDEKREAAGYPPLTDEQKKEIEANRLIGKPVAPVATSTSGNQQ